MPSETYILNLQLQMSGLIEEALTNLHQSIKPIVDKAQEISQHLGNIPTTPIEQVADSSEQINRSFELTNRELARANFAMSKMSAFDWGQASPQSIQGVINEYDQLRRIQEDIQSNTIKTSEEEQLLARISQEREKFGRKFAVVAEKVSEYVEKEHDFLEETLNNSDALHRLTKAELSMLRQRVRQSEALMEVGYLTGRLDKNKIRNLSRILDQHKEITQHSRYQMQQTRQVAHNLNRMGVSPGISRHIADFQTQKVLTDIVLGGFKEILDAQEQFRLTTFRVAGGIDDLVEKSISLQAQLGITSKEATRTVAALAQVGATQSQMEGMTEANAMLARATGASADAAALLQKRMAELIGDIEAGNKALASMIVLSRRAGLTSADLDGVMQEFNNTIFQLQTQYGLSAEGAKQYAQSLGEMAAAAKMAGADVQNMTRQLSEAMRDPLNNIRFLSENYSDFVQATMDNRPREAMRLMGKSARSALEDLEGLSPEIADRVAMARFGKTLSELKQIADTSENLQKVAQMGGDELVEAGKAFDKTFGTLLGQMQRLGAVLMSFVKIALLPFVDFLTSIFSIVGDVVRYMSAFVKPIRDFLKESPNLTKSLKVILGIISGFTILALIKPMFTGFIGMIWKLGSAAKATAGNLMRFNTGQKQIAQTAQQGPSIMKGLSQAGEGISNFFKSFANIPWVAMAKAAVLLGIFTLAVFGLVEISRRLGEDGIGPLMAVSGAMLAVSAALYIAAPAVAAFGAAGLVAIPIILALGAAASAIALSIGYATKAILEGVAAMAPFSDSLTEVAMAGMMGIAAAPGFLALAAGVTALTLAMAQFGISSFIFGNTMQEMVEPLTAMGNALRDVQFGSLLNLVDKIQNADITKIRRVAGAVGAVALAAAAAQEIGNRPAVQAETISTVKITEDTGKNLEKDRRDREELESVKEIVNKIGEVITKIDDSGVREIVSLLHKYLPKIPESSNDFGRTSTNSWG